MASEKRHDYKKPGTTPKTKKSRARGSRRRKRKESKSGIKLTGPTPIASVGAPPKYNNLS